MIIVPARLPILCRLSAFLAILAGCGGNPSSPTGSLTVTELTESPPTGELTGGAGPTVVLGTAVPGGPVAQIDVSATAGIAPLTVRLDASGSRAAAGGIARYIWEFGDGEVGAAAVLFHTFATPGVYAVRLTVYDGQGQSSQAEVQVLALPPVRIVCTPGTLGPAPLSVGVAVDMMGDISGLPVGVDYRWDFGDGTEGLGPSVVHLYERPGRYTVTLILLVGSLFLQGDQLVVMVQESTSQGNQPPIADAGPDQVVVDEDGDGVVRVQLDGSRSYDPDGRIVWYRWRVALGPQQTEVLAEGALASAELDLPIGEHEITLSVTDDCGARGQDALRVSVRQRAALTVTPADDFISHGEVGDLFSPVQVVYVLRNDGQQDLEWTAVYEQTWLAASPNAGLLPAGQSVPVTVIIAGTPAALGVGVYRDTLIFMNRTNGVGTTTRVVQVTVSDPASLVISGRVTEGDVGVPDVVMEGLPGDPTTDGQGYYQASVPHGWSGLVLPTKVDYTFDPPSRRYENVTADMPDQNYAAAAVEPQFADHVSQYGITWTFDRPYRVGQFVNGDWWVCPDTPEGTVLITDITRPHRDHPQHELDGSQINPTTAAQGYDSRESGYNSAVNAALALPVALMGDQSLVSSISWVEGELGCPSIVNGKPRPLLRIVCVLTCLGTPPPADAFRPSAYGNNKTLHRVGMIRWERLPALAPIASTPTLASLEAKFEKFRLDQIGTYSPVEFLHPSEAMPWYGASVCLENGDAALRLCLNDSPAEKTTLLIRYLQYGIDLHGAARSGTRWRANGGHGPGRKLPVLFAGLMLDDENMLAIGGHYPASDDKFGEDAQTWYVNESDIGRALRSNYAGTAQGGSETTITLAPDHPSTYSSWISEGRRIYLVGGKGAGQMRVATAYDTTTKVATISPPWDTVPDETTQYEVRGYEADHVGMPEYGIRHAATPSMDCPTGPTAEYRAINGNALRGTVLAARLLGLKVAWNHDALFDYMDRYYELTAPGGAWHPRPAGYQSAFAEAMWLAYRDGH